MSYQEVLVESIVPNLTPETVALMTQYNLLNFNNLFRFMCSCNQPQTTHGLSRLAVIKQWFVAAVDDTAPAIRVEDIELLYRYTVSALSPGVPIFMTWLVGVELESSWCTIASKSENPYNFTVKCPASDDIWQFDASLDSWSA